MRILLAVFTLALASVSSLGAQTSGSARGIGTGDAHTALVTGYEAGLYNPARLAQGHSSMTLMGLRTQVATGPITFRDLSAYGDYLHVPAKNDILGRVQAAGGQSLDGSIGAHLFGLSSGRFALNLNTVGAGTGTLPSGAVELLLFGNVGQNGDQNKFSFEEARARGHVATYGAFSYGQPLRTPLPGDVSIGATARYGLLHAMIDAETDESSNLTNDPLALSAYGNVVEATGGSAWGADIALSWEVSGWTSAIVFQDVIHGHGLDKSGVVMREYREVMEVADGGSSWEREANYDQLNASERTSVDRRIGAPLSSTRLVAAVGHDVMMGSAFGQFSLGSTAIDPNDVSLTAGTILKPLGFLETRAAAQIGSETKGLSAGLSLHLGPLHLGGDFRRSWGERHGWAFGLQVLSLN